jgi:hypothetical protein
LLDGEELENIVPNDPRGKATMMIDIEFAADRILWLCDG